MPAVPYREGTRNGQSRERGGVPRHPGLRGSEGAREKTRTLASLARGPTRGGARSPRRRRLVDAGTRHQMPLPRPSCLSLGWPAVAPREDLGVGELGAPPYSLRPKRTPRGPRAMLGMAAPPWDVCFTAIGGNRSLFPLPVTPPLSRVAPEWLSTCLGPG